MFMTQLLNGSCKTLFYLFFRISRLMKMGTAFDQWTLIVLVSFFSLFPNGLSVLKRQHFFALLL